jgi:hypothetical protein
MNMSGFTDVFTNPTRFFRDRGEKEPSFRTPLLIMFLWVIIAVITAMFLTAPLTEKIMSTYPEEIAAYASFTKYFLFWLSFDSFYNVAYSGSCVLRNIPLSEG